MSHHQLSLIKIVSCFYPTQKRLQFKSASMMKTRENENHCRNDSDLVKLSAGKAISQTVNAYSENATIHGISYACERSSSILQRLLWSLICATFGILAGFLIWRQYQQWNDKPVITSIKTTGENAKG